MKLEWNSIFSVNNIIPFSETSWMIQNLINFAHEKCK